MAWVSKSMTVKYAFYDPVKICPNITNILTLKFTVSFESLREVFQPVF